MAVEGHHKRLQVRVGCLLSHVADEKLMAAVHTVEKPMVATLGSKGAVLSLRYIVSCLKVSIR